MLERESHAQLQLALRLVGVFVGHLPELLACRIGVRSAPVGVVEEVKSFSPERKVFLFRDMEILENSTVPVLETRVVELITAQLLSESPRGRL